MDNREIALYTAKVLDAKKAQDITIIDIAEKSGFADFFVIATAPNLRLLSSLADEAEDKLAEQAVFMHHKEGENGSGWILLDFGDLIINLFTPEQREHYNIEKLWIDCDKIYYESEEK